MKTIRGGHGVMARLNSIPKAERCERCAGFGRIFHLMNPTQIRYRECGSCGAVRGEGL